MTLDTAERKFRLRRRKDADLPQRVRRAIQEQEERSEILIGWMQLALVLIFGTLYALSPKADGSLADGIRPVPLALGGYLLFTVARLALAYRRVLPRWLLDLSIVFDIALLMGLIWSFHVQYDQPPSFYLKAPTLLYVFIFIALRALRFDPRFVLTAGFVGGIGWLALLGYAVALDPGWSMVTHNYVEYLTGNKILIGAEFDKVISIILVSVILTTALVRARRLLILAATEGEAVRDLKRFFAPEAAEAITGAKEQVTAGYGDVRQAAIMMIDIRGFTEMASTMPPEEVVRVLGEYQRRMLGAVQAHGGAIDKFLGDGIMATFGALTPSPTHARDALRALEAVLDAATAWNAERRRQDLAPLAVNAAVADGRVVVGVIGDGSRLEFTVIGNAVNLAAKLEKHCKIEGARGVALRSTYEHAVDQGYRPAVEPDIRDGRACAGVDRPVDVAAWA